jgi:hypothetical protein
VVGEDCFGACGPGRNAARLAIYPEYSETHQTPHRPRVAKQHAIAYGSAAAFTPKGTKVHEGSADLATPTIHFRFSAPLPMVRTWKTFLLDRLQRKPGDET